MSCFIDNAALENNLNLFFTKVKKIRHKGEKNRPNDFADTGVGRIRGPNSEIEDS